jgi:hypothetical protein
MRCHDFRVFLGLLLCGLVSTLVRAGSASADEPPARLADREQALGRISSDSLRGHLSFLASDLLEGRDTPSRGLDLAAEYIAAQFRRAGLEPVGGDGYFQTANWTATEPDPKSFTLEIKAKEQAIHIDLDHAGLAGTQGFQVGAAGLVKVAYKPEDESALTGLEGKVALVELPDPRKVERTERLVARANVNKFLGRLTAAKVVLVLNLSRDGGETTGLRPGPLVDPRSPEGSERSRVGASTGPPVIAVQNEKLNALFDASNSGPLDATVTAALGNPIARPVRLRNVVGLLPGSDPELKKTYVMVTAHYDHVGVQGPAGTDRIYNGANDDGSGTVSVIELATSLATLKVRPRRSLLFVTFFGEEHGLLGSRYYGRNPVVPVERTVADVNLEQVGRTDSSEGSQVGKASLTGFGYSDVSNIFVEAGKAEGIEVYRHPRNSDAYFGASDNQALADLGVPAHTLCVAYQYPDYHGPADHWEKLDYANMARVDRMVARALLTLADDPAEPKWNEQNTRTAKYVKAWKARRGR